MTAERQTIVSPPVNCLCYLIGLIGNFLVVILLNQVDSLCNTRMKEEKKGGEKRWRLVWSDFKKGMLRTAANRRRLKSRRTTKECSICSLNRRSSDSE